MASVALTFTVRRPYARWRAVAFLIPLTAVILLGLVDSGTVPTAFIWVMVLPVLFYALLVADDRMYCAKAEGRNRVVSGMAVEWSVG